MLLSSITVYFVLTMKIIVWVDTIFIAEVLTEMILIILTLEKLSTFFFGETYNISCNVFPRVPSFLVVICNLG